MSKINDNKNDDSELDGQFKLRLGRLDEEAEERSIPSEINEFRLDKISQRVTLISIMIPVLIVIVLVIAYLDIKKRVVQTEDSGAIEFRKLSSDLESRFSSLSLRQATLEENLQNLTDRNDHAMASIQVRLEKLQEALGALRRDTPGSKAFDALKADLAAQIDGVAASAGEAGRQSAALLQDLKAQVIQQGETLKAANPRIAELQSNISDLENRKIDKQSLDLALRLETLKIETALKTRMDALQTKLNALEKKLLQPPPPAPPQNDALETQIIR